MWEENEYENQIKWNFDGSEDWIVVVCRQSRSKKLCFCMEIASMEVNPIGQR